MNNTTDFEEIYNFNAEKYRIKRIIFYSVVALTTYFGNILILISLRTFSKRLKGTPFIFIGNLAITDLLLATGLTLQLLSYIFTSLEKEKYFCVVKICLISVSLFSSEKLLLLMSLDRFCAIMFPMRHLLRSASRSRRKVKLVFVWAVSVLAGCIPPFVLASSSEIDHECRFGELIPREITLIAAISIPLQFVFNVVLCLIVMWRLRTNPMSRHKYKKSMIKCGLLIKVYVVFAICWAPFVVSTILVETTNQKAKYVNIREYSVLPGLFNSSMNWIIYGFANVKLRNSFKDVLLCRTERDVNVSRYKQNESSSERKDGIDSRQKFSDTAGTCETCA